jgi:acyl-coenzyme A thioesterase PaaI-like protein
MSSEREEKLQRLDQGFTQAVPHNRVLGMRLHGGAITSLLDACCGAAVFMKLGVPAPIATLDLRIDYLRMAEPKRDVLCKCECYKITRSVAFVRGIAYHDDEKDPIAAAAGSFILQGRGTPIVGNE